MAGTTNFPTSLDSHTGGDPFGFAEAVNGLTTTLAATVGTSDTALSVASAASFPSRGYAVIESEVVSYTAKAGSTGFTGVTRGANGTTAAAHVSGAIVASRPVAANHNDLAAAIVALETKVGIGSSGIESTRLAPVDHVSAYAGSSQTIAKTTETAITTFTAEQYDSNTMHDTSSNPSRFYCRTAGLYDMKGQVTWDPSSAGLRETYIRLNGATRLAVNSMAALNQQYVPVHRAYRLSTSDYVELTCWHSESTSLGIVAGALYTYFQMHRIGG